MTAKEIFEKDYQLTRELLEDSDIYNWAADNIFDLTTYDDELDRLFVQVIVDVCKVILARKTFEFIEDEALYVTYIVVCQLLDRKGWINWGTSIRGAWFEEGGNAKPIYDGYGHEEDVPYTKENLIALIEFIEENEPKEEKGENK
jgi:hypothetical protein